MPAGVRILSDTSGVSSGSTVPESVSAVLCPRRAPAPSEARNVSSFAAAPLGAVTANAARTAGSARLRT